MLLAQLLFPVWVDDGLDSHKAFIIQYATGEDLDLSYHFDNAEVTLNVNLGKQFTGDLYFRKIKNIRTSKNVYAFVWIMYDHMHIALYTSKHTHTSIKLIKIIIFFGEEFHIRYMRSLDYQGNSIQEIAGWDGEDSYIMQVFWIIKVLD